MSKNLKAALSLFAAIAAIAAFASPASAAEVSAKFSASTIKLTTTGVTLKKNGGEARTCTPSGGSLGGPTFESGMYLGSFGTVYLNCPNVAEQLQFTVFGSALYDTVTSRYFVKINPAGSSSQYSPYGSYWELPSTRMEPTWINGSGGTNSTLKFENEEIGYLVSGGAKLTLDGTFTATTSSGGLLTLK